MTPQWRNYTMKTGKTLTELCAEIERQRTAKVDFVAPTEQLRAKPDTDSPSGITLVAEGLGSFPMQDLALVQASEQVGIPIKYVRKMATERPELLAHNLNDWFTSTPARRLVRTLDGKARALLSDRYQRIDNYEVSIVALEAFGSRSLDVVSAEVTESRLYIKAIDPSMSREVTSSTRKGDVVQAGVLLKNSEVGLGRLSFEAWALFLACLNGMKREGSKGWNHVGRKIEDQDMSYLTDATLEASDRVDMMVLRDTLANMFDQGGFDAWMSKLEGATSQHITGRPQAAIEVLSERLLLAQSETDNILGHLIRGGDLSRYGLINAVTRTAEDVHDYDRATELEGIGNRILDLPASDWRVIAEAA
jgi:hypothetical protein